MMLTGLRLWGRLPLPPDCLRDSNQIMQSDETTPVAITLPSLDPINLLVGQGIQQFASLELMLGMVFASMMEPGARERSIVVFHSIKTFEGKLTAFAALSEVALSNDQRAQCVDLLREVKAIQKFRNKLAHWNASLYPGAKSAADIRRMKPVLIPPHWSAEAMRTLWGRGGQMLTVAQLRHGVDSMVKLTTKIAEFGQTFNRA